MVKESKIIERTSYFIDLQRTIAQITNTIIYEADVTQVKIILYNDIPSLSPSLYFVLAKYKRE